MDPQDYNECMFNIVKVALGRRQMEYDTGASYAWARVSANLSTITRQGAHQISPP